MILRVAIADYPKALDRHLGRVPVYVRVVLGVTVITAADPKRDLILRATCDWPKAKVEALLEGSADEVVEGEWIDEGSDDLLATLSETWLAAVAYRSSDKTPGLWVDAYATEPSAGDVLSKMYNEFVDTGEVRDLPLEEFLRITQPNVVLLSPDEQRQFAKRNAES